jgi:hypothetical protein
MIGKALGGLGPDSRKPLELSDQFGKWAGKEHRGEEVGRLKVGRLKGEG